MTEHFLKNDGRIHRLPDKTHFTSVENLKEEKALLKSANRLANQSGHNVSVEKLEVMLLDHKANPMNWEQAAALGHITLNNQSISIVRGKAGTGKTHMLKAARKLWEENGNRVLGLCVAGKAARGLHEATGMQTETVAKFLYDNDQTLSKTTRHHARQFKKAARGQKTTRHEPVKIDAKTILVIDEAAMLCTRDMRKVLQEVEQVEAKVVLVGDAKQLQPIAPGNPFQALADRLGAIHIDEVRRQQNPHDRQMVSDLSEGSMQSALESLADRGLVHLAEDRSTAIKHLVTDWSAAGKESNSLILVPSKKEASEINRQCQNVRQRRGEVRNGIGIRIQEQVIQVGDRVQFSQRDRRLGLENGDFGNVDSVNRVKKNLTVRLDSGRKVLVPIDQYDSVRLGYATTVHKGQGITVERAFVLLGGHLQDQHLSYVQLSRSRQSTQVYVDRYEAGQNYSDLLSTMERNRQRTLAIDLGKICESLSQSPEI